MKPRQVVRAYLTFLISLSVFIFQSGCGGGGTAPSGNGTGGGGGPQAPSAQLLYVNTNGIVPGVFGYKIQSDGTLTAIAGLENSLLAGGSGIVSSNGVLYIPGSSGGIFAGTINFQTGSVTSIGTFPGPALASNATTGVQLSICQNKFLYAERFAQIFAYAIDTTGGLKQAPGSPLAADPGLTTIAVDPLCKFLFALSTVGTFVYTIDSTSGSLTLVAGSPFAANSPPSAGVVDPTGKFFFAVNSTQLSAFSISSQGVLSLLSSATPPSGGIAEFSMTFVSTTSGNFLYVTNSGVFGYRVDTGTGALTSLSNPLVAPSFLTDTRALAASGNFLYALDFNPRNVSAFTINSDGTLTALSGSPFALNFSTSALHPMAVTAAVKP